MELLADEDKIPDDQILIKSNLIRKIPLRVR